MTIRTLRITFLTLCGLILAMPLLLWPVARSKEPADENRKLAEWLDLSDAFHRETASGRSRANAALSGLKRFAESFDSFFSDRFPLRGKLLEQHHAMRRRIFDSNPIQERVYWTEQGWYFLGDSYGDLVMESSGRKVMSAHELAAIDNRIEAAQAWCAARGIAFHVAVVRDKQSIMPEALPYARRDAPSNFSLIAALHAGAQPVLDLNALERAHRDFPPRTYRRTDSHWNSLGAYWGFCALMQGLGLDSLLIRSFGPDSFQWDSTMVSDGDLTRLLGIAETETVPDARPLFELGAQPADTTIKWANGDRIEIIRFRNPRRQGRIVLFRDSFADARLPFLREAFGETVVVRGSLFDAVLLEAEHPDYAVTQVVERQVDHLRHLTVSYNRSDR
ncbi:MAG: hypothetical protein IPJ85_18225 [Flavobacteriales bacterium]|nr:hypothetical protein [Flavobacteriales bacterium]